MKYRLVETKEIIDRVLKFSESHANSKHNGNIVDIIDMYQERPEIFRWLHIYEAVSEVEDVKSFKTNYIFIKVPYEIVCSLRIYDSCDINGKPRPCRNYIIPDTLNFSQNDLKCMQRVAMANPNLLRLQTLYSKWDLECSWSQSSFFSIFVQMLWSIKSDLMKGGVK